ncbi:hypothetical protein KA005_08830 [bacterium]|nr:hypothetical protein [bacterium]
MLALKKGRAAFLELKEESGRMSDDQKQMRLIRLNRGHEIYEVRSFKRYLEIVNE